MPYEDRVEIVSSPPEVTAADPDAVPAEKTTGLTSEEKNWAMLCHLSAVPSGFVTGMSFLGPLICWLIKKDSSRFVDDQGKEALNFQLNILIYLVAGVVIAIVTCGIGVVVPIAIGIYALILPIIGGMKANNGERYRYPLTFRIIQ